MSNVSNAFDNHRGGLPLRTIAGDAEWALPWQAAVDGQMPPMMFQLRLPSGCQESFPYGDIRRIRCRDAGCIQIETFSSPRTQIVIEGRHLRELASLLGMGMIQWIEVTDGRDVDRPEDLPTITTITIELFPVSQGNS